MSLFQTGRGGRKRKKKTTKKEEEDEEEDEAEAALSTKAEQRVFPGPERAEQNQIQLADDGVEQTDSGADPFSGTFCLLSVTGPLPAGVGSLRLQFNPTFM